MKRTEAQAAARWQAAYRKLGRRTDQTADVAPITPRGKQLADLRTAHRHTFQERQAACRPHVAPVGPTS